MVARATIRTVSAACGDFTICCRLPRCGSASPMGEGQTLLHASEGVARYVGMAPGRLVLAVRRDEPLGQLQGQRHVGRVQPRPAGRRHPGRLRLDRQHQRLAGPLLLRHAADEGRDLHRLGQDLLRQAFAGARLRRADRADRRRLRRRHGPRPGGQQATGHLSGQQRQSLPAGRAEDDHVPRAGSAGLGGARLDRRARRKPGQLQRLRQGVPRAARTGPDRPHPAAGRRSTPPGPTRSTNWSSSAACAGTAAGRTWRSPSATTTKWTRRATPGLDHRQRHRNQPAGEPDQVHPRAGVVQRRGARR